MPLKIVIIGAGPGGYVAAVRAAQSGADVTIIEKYAVGGTCLNKGCIPSEILKKSADVMDTINHSDEFGVIFEKKARPDMLRIMERKNKIILQQVKGIEALLAHHRIIYIKGEAFIQDRNMVQVIHVDGEPLSVPWDKLILAAGTRPLGIAEFPFDGKKILSSDDMLELAAVPKHVAIVGGGIIGCKFACILSSLGAQVTLIESKSRLIPLPWVDPEISAVLHREMKKRKITCWIGHKVTRIDEKDDLLHLTISEAGLDPDSHENKKNVSIEAEKMVVCIGRKPQTDHLGLENIGVGIDDKGWVQVNENLETNIKHVYAVGDILGPSRNMQAHVASAEGAHSVRNIMGNPVPMVYDYIPVIAHTSPEIGCVGLTEEQTLLKGITPRKDCVLFRAIGKVHVEGNISGQMTIISDAQNGKITGVHIIGPHAAELIGEATLALKMGATVHDLAETVHAHPTVSEIMMEASFKAMDHPLHG